MQSTKTLLLAPDLAPTKLKQSNVLRQHIFGDTELSSVPSEFQLNEGMKETRLTMVSAERLSYFRTMMKCLNDIQCQGARQSF